MWCIVNFAGHLRLQKHQTLLRAWSTIKRTCMHRQGILLHLVNIRWDHRLEPDLYGHKYCNVWCAHRIQFEESQQWSKSWQQELVRTNAVKRTKDKEPTGLLETQQWIVSSSSNDLIGHGRRLESVRSGPNVLVGAFLLGTQTKWACPLLTLITTYKMKWAWHCWGTSHTKLLHHHLKRDLTHADL